MGVDEQHINLVPPMVEHIDKGDHHADPYAALLRRGAK